MAWAYSRCDVGVTGAPGVVEWVRRW